MHARADVSVCLFMCMCVACVRGHLHRVRDIHAGNVHGTEEERQRAQELPPEAPVDAVTRGAMAAAREAVAIRHRITSPSHPNAAHEMGIYCAPKVKINMEPPPCGTGQ
jgi:hypothetical protein